MVKENIMIRSMSIVMPAEISAEALTRHRAKPMDIIMSLSVRVVFILQILFVIGFLWQKTKYVVFLSVGICVILADGLFVVIKRNGKEHLWFEIS